MILTLDLGTHCGWAFNDRNGDISHGTEHFDGHVRHGPALRWLQFRSFLSQKGLSINTVYYEDVRRHVGTDAAHVYGGFLALLQIYAHVNNARLVGVGVGVIKKHWTGKGNASKDLMIAAAIERGFKPVDDNAADALALLSYALEQEELAPF